MNYGAVILAGGKSSRMGRPKSLLQLNGVRFLDRLVYELSGFQELLVSVDDARKHPEIEYPMVSDVVTDCGPLGGLYAALKNCTSDALVTVPCDVPLFSRMTAEQMYMLLEQEQETDAVITVTRDGKEHPLCGVYKKSCLAVFEQCLQQKNYRVRDALAGLNVKRYQAGKDSWRFRNVNTPEEFKEIEHYRQIPDCLAVCGWKNAGKTTLIENLVPMLKRRGLKTAVIKHDGHSYEPDVPGTDSYRFYQAGADISAVYDKNKYSVTRRISITDEEAPGLACGADIILLEGFKRSSFPKIEIVRKENGQMPVPGLKGRIACVSDMELSAEFSMEVPVLKLWDMEGIAAFIMEAYVSGRLQERWDAGIMP